MAGTLWELCRDFAGEYLTMNDRNQSLPSRSWVSSTVLGIIAATFFSDVSHEMATAVLPLYFATLGLGPAALGAMEGMAGFLVRASQSSAAAGWGHVRQSASDRGQPSATS